MAPLPEHMDPDKLFVSEESPPKREAEPADEHEETTVPAKPEKKAEPEHDDDDDQDDDGLSLEELEELIDKRVEARKGAKDAVDPLDDLLMDDRDREIATLKKERDDLKAKAEKSDYDEKFKAAKHEMDSAIGKLKMTAEQRDNTIAWFEQNPDLEGNPAWPFERVAVRVNPELRGHVATPDSPAESGEGEQPNRTARVINRGASDGSPPSPPKRDKAARGIYSDVSRNVLSSGRASQFFTREGR